MNDKKLRSRFVLRAPRATQVNGSSAECEALLFDVSMETARAAPG